MNKAIKSALCAVATMASAMSFASGVAYAWGDSDGGRPSYTIDQINSGVLGDKIVLNSISNSTIGDEKNFVGARLDGSANSWYGNEITAEDDKTYIVRLYVHNNNPGATAANATGVKTTFAIPTTSNTSVEVNGFIDSDNATPKTYWDNVIFKSNNGNKFHLEYIAGSALLENNGIGANGGVKLSDDLVKTGTLIGYTALDGNVPGCYQYANYITIKVKAVYDKEEELPTFTMEKQVRLVGETEWHKSVTAKKGDKVEFQTIYKNTANVTEYNVTVKEILAENLSYVKGTTKLYNAKYPSGLIADDDLTGKGLGIGAYTADSNAIIRFTAEVKDGTLKCGENNLHSWAQVSINGNQVKQDDASVLISKTCENPEPPVDPEEPEEPEPPVTPVLPETGASDMLGAILGAGSLTTALGFFLKSRKHF